MTQKTLNKLIKLCENDVKLEPKQVVECLSLAHFDIQISHSLGVKTFCIVDKEGDYIELILFNEEYTIHRLTVEGYSWHPMYS